MRGGLRRNIYNVPRRKATLIKFLRGRALVYQCFFEALFPGCREPPLVLEWP